jgi:folate-dependent phosphoribosylglycinamide formyltransferase PurN
MITNTIPNLLRQARDAAAWRPANARLLLDQVVERGRNARAGFDDAAHLRAAAAWLERAQDASGDGGVSGRYRLKSGWTPSYPETTGYIVPTFLQLAEEPGGERFRDRARRAVDFLLALQLPNGAFPGGELSARAREASFFNTGQILAGLIGWHQSAGDARVLEAARRAADWLVSIQSPDGAFRTHLYHDLVTTYGAHSSCWLAEFGHHTRDKRYINAATRHVEWVLTNRDAATGWIDKCGFTPANHQARQSVTHTIAYTLWGVLTTSRIAGRADGVAAVEQAALAIARRLELSGTLPGVLDSNWKPAAAFSCLTGNAQMALVWLALYELGADARFLNAALKAIDLVKTAQPLSNPDPGIRGGIPGSDPIWGSYIRMAVPNWSAKFFIDALLAKRATLAALDARPRGVAAMPPDVRECLPAVDAQPRSDIRVVVLATPSSKKVARMLEWNWGFRPAGVVVLSKRRPDAWTRFRQRVASDGLFGGSRRRHRESGASASTGGGSGDVRALCRSRGIPIVEVDSLDSADTLERIRALTPDVFVFAGGAILRRPLLEIPRLGTLNAHMGLLPFYRGMNVVEWASFHGDPIGCSVHQIDPGIDTGDILCIRSVSVDGARSVAELRQRVDDAQLALLGEVVRFVIASGALPPARSQSPAEGRQYFRMHDELIRLLERELETGGRVPAQEPELRLAGLSR